jgi:aryl-alcohol dehydrogenase-like predicted oxidoreductase
MKYARLGDTGLIVSRLGFGALTFTQGNQSLGSVYKVGTALADQLVSRAIEAGVTLFDTADVYADGESETLLGAALKPHRERVVLTSKVGNRSGRDVLANGLSRRHIFASIDASLQRLGTDHLDLYVAHREDLHTPLEETLEAFDAIVRAGKARYIGFSNWSAWKAAAALEFQMANGLARFTHGQYYHSLLGRDVERDVLPMLQHFGLGMTVWSPLAYGFLAGGYTRERLKEPGNRITNFGFLQFDEDKAFSLLDVMRTIAAERSCSMAQLAIAWLLAKRGVTSVLIGATKIAQLDDNLRATDVALPPEDIAALDAASAITPLYPSSDWIEPDRKTVKALS